MAGDGWVMDIIWHTLLLCGDAMGGIWSSWSTEILLGLSFVAQLYAEKTMALRRANLANVRRTVERERRLQRRRSRTTKANLSFAGDDDEGGLLMKAHTLFPICKNSMVDSSVETASNTDDAAIVHAKETLFREENYKIAFRVMEMELSLMYDFLYTKAAIIHTWHGYAIRAVSPVFTAVSLVLVELSNVAGHHRRSDVVITRVLLVATFLLETLSLLRALASSWTGFWLDRELRPVWGCGWIRHEVLCRSRWTWLRRQVASIGRLAGAKDHRRWCGKMGQLSVLQLIITSEREDRSWDKECERYSKEKTIVVPQDVKELFFRRLLEQLIDLRKRMKADTGTETELRTMVANMRTKRGQLTLQNYDLWNQLRWSLGDELQLGILTWHIATDIYLSQSVKAIIAAVEDANKEKETRRLQKGGRLLK
uniref:DUF4220 domain-containing protein n=1 Tax=Oryza rufipogon TaxID=4529 RepID=A0A0E0P579_ORYRU